MTKTTPLYTMTPDFTAVARMMAMQTKFAAQSSEAAMRFAYLPWKSLSAGLGALNSVGVPKAAVSAKVTAKTSPKVSEKKPAKKAAVAEAPVKVEPVAKPAPAKVASTKVEPAAKPVEKKIAKPEVNTPAPAEKVAAPARKAAAPKNTTPKAVAPAPKVVEAPKVVDAKVAAPKPAAEPKAEAPAPVKATAKPVKTEVKPTPKAKPASPKPEMLKAARNGKADDLTQLKGVGPKLALALQEAGIFHYDQIAEWTEDQTAWVDDNIAGVRGRASRNEWVNQALELATA